MTSTSSEMVKERKLSPEEHRKAIILARCVYVFIAVSFVSICFIAVVMTMDQEKNKSGFRAITVKQPISFIDRTYMKDDAATAPATVPSSR